MNRTIISIEVQDEGGKEANIIVRGERNGQILFEELFKYHDEEKHPLRLHLLKEEYVEEGYRAEGKILGVMCIQKLLRDITHRSKYSINGYDYRTTDKSKLTFEIVENRLREIAERHNISLNDEEVLYLYSKEYGSLTNEIADILFPRYGFKGIYPTPRLRAE